MNKQTYFVEEIAKKDDKNAIKKMNKVTKHLTHLIAHQTPDKNALIPPTFHPDVRLQTRPKVTTANTVRLSLRR